MTPEMQKILTRELEAAKTPEEIDRALINSMTALVDCQCKTAERVKGMVADREAEKNRREGAKWLWGSLATLAASGGGALILKLLATIKL